MNVLGITPYHYAKRLNGSLTNKFVPEYFKTHRRRIELLYEQHQYWNLCTEEVKQILGSLYSRILFRHWKEIVTNVPECPMKDVAAGAERYSATDCLRH